MLERLMNEYLYTEEGELRLTTCLTWLTDHGYIPTSEEINTIADTINTIRNELHILSVCNYRWYTKESNKYQNIYGFTGMYF